MRYPSHWHILTWAGFVAIVLGSILIGSASTARSRPNPTATQARFATPLSSPTNNGGSATWSVQKMTFVSLYPKGFDFVIQGRSSGGRITKAYVQWRHAMTHPNAMAGTPDDTGAFTVHWRSLPAHNIPQWVGVDYWWTLTDEQGNTFETPHGYTEYADATRPWKRLVSEDAVIHWEASLPADLGTRIADALKAQRGAFLRAWGKLLNYKPQIIIYASYTPWQEWHPEIDTTRIDGETDPDWGSTVQVYRARAVQATALLADAVVLHEMEHLYQMTFGGYGTYLIQVWFYEGDATYLERYQAYDYLQTIKDLAASGQLPSLTSVGQRTKDRLAYDEGYAFWKYLDVTYGPDTHRIVWEQIGKGQPIVLALQTATGKRFPELEQDFRKWLLGS